MQNSELQIWKTNEREREWQEHGEIDNSTYIAHINRLIKKKEQKRSFPSHDSQHDQ